MLLRFITFFLVFIPHSSYGIYEDQIGLFDWKQSYIGHVSFAAFDSLSDTAAGSRSIFAASADSGVIGALSVKDGSVVWRHFFSAGEKISFITLFSDCLLVLSGNNVRCFYPEGILKTQLTLPINEHESVKLLRSTDEAILFATEHNVCVLRGNSFKCMPIPSHTKSMHFVGCIDDISACIIAQEASGGVTVYQAAVDTGKLVKLSSGNLDSQLTRCGSLSDGQTYMCTLANGKLLGPVDFRDFSTANLAYVNYDCQQSNDDKFKAVDVKAVSKSLLVTFDDGKKTFCKMPNKERIVLGSGATIIDAANVEYNGKDVAFVLTSEGSGNFRLVLFDEAGSQLADSAFSSREVAAEGVDSLFPIVLKKRGAGASGNAPILRCLVRTKYDTLVFVQGGAVKWTRDEGLGQALSAIFFDLPLPGYLADIASEVVSQNSNIFMCFIRRVKFESDILFSTIFDLIEQVSHGGFGALLHFNKDVKHSLLHHQINRHTGDGRDVAVELHRDKFGLEKLIIVVTAPGKVYAIHSLTGVVVWDLLLRDCRPISIFQMRGTDDTRLPSKVAVIGHNISSHDQMCIVAFDGLTGIVQEAVTYSFLPGVVRPFTHADPETRITPLLLLVPTHSTVHVFPSSLTDFVHSTSTDVYLYLVTQKVNTEVTGYHLEKSPSVASQMLSLSKTWSVKLPSGEFIVTVAERRPDERVYSKAVVLADRTVLYRYLNPNLVFIVTATPPVDRKDTDKEVLSIYLVDSVSGRFYYQGQHRHARQPVFAVNAENFVAYSYWNSQMRRTEVAVIELFEGKSECNASVFSSFDNYGPEVPMVLKQAYVLNDIVRSMVVTTSRRGIASRSVLLGMASGRVLEVPKLLLNPRRLLITTQEHAEEGIPPYVPEIIMHPESFINYNRSLERITNMYTAASGLESTSLLFVTGLDIYFARVWPSKMFDMLKEDFDYAFIIMITVGLLAATFIFRYFVHAREVKKAWQ